MAKGRPLQPLEVSRDTRGELEALARSRSLPAGLVSRARIVLLCAEGLDNSAVAERLRVPPDGRPLSAPRAYGPLRRTPAGTAAHHHES